MARDLAAENRELRARIAALTEEATANERLLNKNQARELELLKADTLPQLFSAICCGLRESYRLETTTLVLLDGEHEIRHLLQSDGTMPDELPFVLFADVLAEWAPQFNVIQRPWLGPFVGSDHHRIFPGSTDLASVALIPLLRHEKIIGSLNFGSAEAKRFSRHLATDFLAHLGVITAFALENTINRARLVRSGLTDFLTGWHNRRYLHARLREELARAQRQQHSLTCLIIDLDRFKLINDQYGHPAGDAALREAAQRIQKEIRSSDTAARFGGDEFVLLVPGMNAEQATVLAERIRLSVATVPLTVSSNQHQRMTVSVGVASVSPQRTSELQVLGEQLLSSADQALYRAKEKGRNRVEVMTTAMHTLPQFHSTNHST